MPDRPPAFKERQTSIALVSTRDGTSNTFLVGELAYGLEGLGGFTQWATGYPYHSAASTAGVFDATDAGPMGLDFRTWETFRSDHPGNVLFVFCDGHVQAVSSHTDATTLDNLANREDGQAIGAF
jgi:prepilin-type processing-associated H-X9-DG protein